MENTYSETEWTHEGVTYKSGDTFQFDNEAFATCLIIGFYVPHRNPELPPPNVWVKLARPYAYATGTGTACPGVLTGVETFTTPLRHLLERDKINANGKPGHKPGHYTT